ncbi:MAG: V-type ATP synthase subunit A [Tenericutes bacterium GWC2_39_45]|nr:MAG: V-type ATP synthase subunit A [Tenericutes bacterium GWA2_38_26]OHE30393.1 MAG: V-type ATP synthase subunit A [Tenericutes bacterium GWC2_39_45]OHE31423.1 MAG: V-type ATP synthase subunit A [Tenericutes bacterium GWD2_38_27]OHE41070.1 MAG: V-type ATP synthase subunit A [Tenericutes bacterium GWF2_38_8]HBG32409.1 V-type ATP synthase subunit A [Acholeplasmataceae bacterium]
MQNTIYSINGPVVTVKNATVFSMLEMVYVGKDRLLGEVISISKNHTTIQVYESTTGLVIGEPVFSTGEPISALLGPGLLKNIFDGIERPLKTIAKNEGIYIPTGSDVEALDRTIEWEVKITVKNEDMLHFGQIYATIQETASIEHRLMVPKDKDGRVVWIAKDGKYKLFDVIVKVEDLNGHVHELTLAQKWPIKTPRPVQKRLPITIPLVSGQRVIDTLFPIAKGGTAAVPGGFGTGKTMMQHQFAKWCDADLIVYVGCGERGNEMTQVLEEFSELIDPRTNKPLMERTVLIANTSNMPVAAREASIYTGVAIAEYYRDMGYHVAVMADSTSRWAEALREISGRLEEMPAEEGFPAYLPSRISQFYERAGYMMTLSGEVGSISIIGAVSPQGADFSEPVTQNTKRFVRSFWALDKQLAYMRHYAAINWNLSYSEYINDLTKYYDTKVSPRFLTNRKEIMSILAEENKLLEIVKLIGSDVLPDDQKLIIEVGKVIRLGYLQQNAFHKDDTYVPLEKQLKMMDVILYLYKKAKGFVEEGKSLNLLLETGIFDQVIKMKYDVANDELDKLDDYPKTIDKMIKRIH